MKTLSFCIALFIMAFGAVCVVLPARIAWIAQHATTPAVFYVVSAVRIAFGVILIRSAPFSRAPKALRAVGYFVLLAGIATALTAWLAMERARAVIEWWVQQGSGIGILTGALLLAFGGFIACACAPIRRAEDRRASIL